MDLQLFSALGDSRLDFPGASQPRDVAVSATSTATSWLILNEAERMCKHAEFQ